MHICSTELKDDTNYFLFLKFLIALAGSLGICLHKLLLNKANGSIVFHLIFLNMSVCHLRSLSVIVYNT